MVCPSCGKAMQPVQRVTVEASFVNVENEAGNVEEKIDIDEQRSQSFWECKPCKVSRLDE